MGGRIFMVVEHQWLTLIDGYALGMHTCRTSVHTCRTPCRESKKVMYIAT